MDYITNINLKQIDKKIFDLSFKEYEQQIKSLKNNELNFYFFISSILESISKQKHV